MGPQGALKFKQRVRVRGQGMKEKRRCKTCGRVLADENKKDDCFSCQPAELPKFEQRGADSSGEDMAEYQRQYYRLKRRAAAI